MPSPTFDATLHDISIGGLGYMLAPEGRVVRQDAVPATSRAAQGEGRYDLYQIDAFYAQATSAGGAGQSRLSSSDSYLSGVCDTRWGGHIFPARKLIAAANTGGTASFMFHRDSTVYGFVSTNIEQFGSASTFAAGAVPRNQPVVDGQNNAFYVTAANALYRWLGSGSATDITANLGGGITPYAVAAYHRYLWCLATQSVESTGTLVQSKVAITGTTDEVRVQYDNALSRASVLAVFIFSEDTTPFNTPTVTPDGWVQRATVSNTNITGICFTCDAPSSADRTVVFEFDTADEYTYVAVEVSGVDLDAPFLDITTDTDTTTGYDSGTVDAASGTAIFVACDTANNATSTVPASYTDFYSAHAVGSATAVQAYYRADTTDTTVATASATNDTESVNFLLKLRSNSITSDQTQFALLYTEDGGNTWTLPLSSTGAGIGAPTAAFAVGGFLWFTTPRGLYQVGVEDEVFADGESVLNVFVRGPVDTFNAPSNSAAAGVWIAHFDGSLYYAVGQTVRAYPIGGLGGRQVWPTADWGTVGGNIGAVVAGEGGVYFGAGTTLYNFNGRGFHPLATNATANIYDYLYWHQGRLYVNKDPAEYYDFGYPSLRPDIYATAATNFETGYWISSLLDFEKMDVYKHIGELQTFAEFSATSNSGTITLDYISADTGAQPDRLGGGATSLTWTTIGTHTVSDTNVKTYNPTVIKAKAIFLRLTIAPGASGYPIVHSVVANGTAIMPPVDRIIAPIMLAGDVRNKSGALMYANAAAVWTAKDELRDLRRGTNTVAVKIIDDDGGNSAYTCVVEQLQDSIGRFKKGNRSVTGDAQMVFRQIPGTTITETRP
jgi:hypothetical protein